MDRVPRTMTVACYERRWHGYIFELGLPVRISSRNTRYILHWKSEDDTLSQPPPLSFSIFFNPLCKGALCLGRPWYLLVSEEIGDRAVEIPSIPLYHSTCSETSSLDLKIYYCGRRRPDPSRSVHSLFQVFLRTLTLLEAPTLPHSALHSCSAWMRQ